MKLERATSFVWSCLFAFLLSLASTGCLVSAFSLTVDMGNVALCCACGAVFCSICYVLPLKYVPLSGGLLMGIYFWHNGNLELTVESLLYRLSRQYHMAYRWETIHWTMRTSDDMELTLQLGVCILGVLVAMAIAWAICRRKTLIPGVGLCVLQLGACMVVTDTVPHLGWLFLLLLGILMLLLTHSVRRQNEEQGNRLSTLLLLPAALLLGILFLACPRETYAGQPIATAMMESVLRTEFIEGLLGRATEVGTTGSSVDSGIVRLDAVGVRMNSQAEILQLTSNYSDRLYLRGRALDTYDGLTWTDSGESTERLNWPSEKILQPAGEVIITTKYAHRMLYLPYYVTSTDLTDMTRGLENKKKLKQYSFTCGQMPKSYELQAYGDESWTSASSYTRYTHLTPEVQEWAKPLAQEIIGDIQNPYLQAQAIGDYVRAGAAYDTNTWKMPSSEKDFARWFLEDSDTGYCVHFATAATVLLQAAGIPARYITGYAVDSQVGYLTIVRADDAHAWAEYWLPGYGWTVLEATPSAGVTVPEETEESTQSATEAATQPGETESQGEMNTQPTGSRPTEGISQTTSPDVKQPEKKVDIWPWVWSALGLLLAGVGLWLQRWIRLKLRRKRLIRGTTNQRAVACWQEAARLSRFTGKPVDKDLFEIAQKAKFSQHTITQEELTRFAVHIADAHSLLRRRSVLRRFWYRVIWALY